MRRFLRAITFAALVGIAGPQRESAGQSTPAPTSRDSAVFVRPPAGAACEDCGVVRSVREVHRRRDTAARVTATPGPPPSSFDSSRVVGALVVLPWGSQAGFVGGVGTEEMSERFGTSTYEVIVRMDDGSYRTVERRDGASYGIGDRVRLAEGRLEVLPTPR